MANGKKVKYEDNQKIVFSREYSFNGKWTNALEMREPTFGDELNIGEVPLELKNATMFSNLCDISVDEMKPLSAKDMIQVVEAYESFL